MNLFIYEESKITAIFQQPISQSENLFWYLTIEVEHMLK